LAFGAETFVSKSADAAAIGDSVRAVLRGEDITPAGFGAEPGHGANDDLLEIARRMAQLTPQQFRVLGMLCAGRLNKQIAEDFAITEATVKAHMTAILRKLGASTRTQAVLLAGRLARESTDIKALPDDVE
jgi:DNA-binding NarL/FixJ family response regulator